MCPLGACLYHINHRVLKMKAKKVCTLCKDTGVVVFTFEYPNLIDSQWCDQCEAGRKLASLIDDLIARTLPKVRAA
jgi:hypothetical protein